MPRAMSFAKTTEQIRHRTKTVTRRLGWWDILVPGNRLWAVGPRRGEKMERLALIEVVKVSNEPLDAIDAADVEREGFPGMTPAEFVEMFCRETGVYPRKPVVRIEFRYVD